jgi:hypothetical protein
LNLNTPRVLAFGPNGTFGWQAGGGDAAFVEQTALEQAVFSLNRDSRIGLISDSSSVLV